MRRVYAVLGVVLVGGAIAAAVVLGGKKAPSVTEAKINALAVAAGCTPIQTPADEGRGHVSPPQTVQYKSDPPTSGQHYNIPGTAPANTGVWTTPIPNEDQVHNLEHGHTGVQYLPSLDPSIKAALESVARDPAYNDHLFVAPRPSMPATEVIAVTAWGHISTCAKPASGGSVATFVKAWADFYSAGKAPEGLIPATPNP